MEGNCYVCSVVRILWGDEERDVCAYCTGVLRLKVTLRSINCLDNFQSSMVVLGAAVFCVLKERKVLIWNIEDGLLVTMVASQLIVPVILDYWGLRN